MVLSDLGRKLADEVTDTIFRKVALVDHPDDKTELARTACEAALGASAFQYGMAHGSVDFDDAVKATFENLRERWVISIVRRTAEKMSITIRSGT